MCTIPSSVVGDWARSEQSLLRGRYRAPLHMNSSRCYLETTTYDVTFVWMSLQEVPRVLAVAIFRVHQHRRPHAVIHARIIDQRVTKTISHCCRPRVFTRWLTLQTSSRAIPQIMRWSKHGSSSKESRTPCCRLREVSERMLPTHFPSR